MKEFNTTAVCVPSKHYMVDVTDKVQEIKALVDAGKYFTINRARQYGKTTTLNATQTTSLIRIIQQYKSGLLNINQAVSIMQSMGLDETFARKLLEDEEKVKDVLG